MPRAALLISFSTVEMAAATALRSLRVTRSITLSSVSILADAMSPDICRRYCGVKGTYSTRRLSSKLCARSRSSSATCPCRLVTTLNRESVSARTATRVTITYPTVRSSSSARRSTVHPRSCSALIRLVSSGPASTRWSSTRSRTATLTSGRLCITQLSSPAARQC